VETEILPEPVFEGTVVLRLIEVAPAATPMLRLNVRRLLLAMSSKLVPLIVTAVPAIPTAGVNPVSVGALLDALTENESALVPVPSGAVTEIGPVLAPAGTVTTKRVELASMIDAVIPLN
jgi:hypothetical protein